MQTEPILTETIASIQDILGADLDRITVERAVVGLFFTGVKLDTGVTGACATPLRSIPDARAPLLGKLRGRLAGELLKEAAAPSGIRRAVGIAAMNALADMWRLHDHSLASLAFFPLLKIIRLQRLQKPLCVSSEGYFMAASYISAT